VKNWNLSRVWAALGLAGISHNAEGFCSKGQKGGAEQAAEKRFTAVILSEAKNLCICKIRQMRRSFVAYGSSG
jgi:hypothetical protein